MDFNNNLNISKVENKERIKTMIKDLMRIAEDDLNNMKNIYFINHCTDLTKTLNVYSGPKKTLSLWEVFQTIFSKLLK